MVGGGVVGCAAAFELARAGYGVTLVERDGIAAHASGKNAGNLNPLIGTPAGQVAAALEAFGLHAEVYAALREMGCADYALSPVRRVHLGFEDSERGHLAEIAAAGAGGGFSARWLDGAALRGLEPRLAADVRFGVLTEGSCSVASGDFAQALARGAVALGSEIIMGEVAGIVSRNERVVAVEIGDGTVMCDALVLATGPWVGGAEKWLGRKIPVSPVKGQMLRIGLAGGVPACDFTWGGASLYRRQGDEIWVGVTMERCGFDASTSVEARDMLLEQAARILPEVKQAVVLEHMAALRPMADGGEWIAARVPGWQNAYLANGGGAKGVLFSVLMARRLRALLADAPVVR